MTTGSYLGAPHMAQESCSKCLVVAAASWLDRSGANPAVDEMEALQIQDHSRSSGLPKSGYRALLYTHRS